MTLDELIERLDALRRACPAAALATVIGLDDEHAITYDRGFVYVTTDEDDGEHGWDQA